MERGKTVALPKDTPWFRPPRDSTLLRPHYSRFGWGPGIAGLETTGIGVGP